MYTAKETRYETMEYRRCGKSGVKLPLISLGMWHNFGEESDLTVAKEMILGAFDLGIVHFDLANNYGPPAGAAEATFGKVYRENLTSYRDEMFIATKAGYPSFPGPYGDWGSKKAMLASLDRSLERIGVDHVDLFYHHRADPDTPLAETAEALATAVEQGKALYVGVSKYSAEETKEISRLLQQRGVKLLTHQLRYNMFDREAETELFPVMEEEGIGAIAFSSLAQGLLTSRYLEGIPADSRAARNQGNLKENATSEQVIAKVRELGEIAKERGQSISQMALAWNLRLPIMSSLIIGASRLEQIEENVKMLENLTLSQDETQAIEAILAK